MIETFRFILAIFFLTNSVALFSQEKTINLGNCNLAKKGICAHRGANETHPENTIAAFEEAIRLGAQMIEFDVRMTKDNKLIIMHDRSVDRTTNGIGLVEELTWKKIKKLDAGQWKSEIFKGEKVPLNFIKGFSGVIKADIKYKGDFDTKNNFSGYINTKNIKYEKIVVILIYSYYQLLAFLVNLTISIYLVDE